MMVLVWVVVLGILAGWLAGLIAKGRGFGLLGDLIVGIVCSLLGSFIFGLIGLAAYELLGRLVISVVGAIVLLWLIRLIKSLGSRLSTTDLKVEGTTDTPDFSLRTTDEPVALHTDFSAVVDGTNGNAYLQSITARFRNTTLAVSGKVVDIDPEVRGRTILLDADSMNARVEDLIRLAVKKADPVMTGSAWLRTEINIPEGNSDLIERLRLKGQFGIGGAQFTNPEVQEKIDTLSRKGQGAPKDVDINDVVSGLRENFRVNDGIVTSLI